MNVPGSVTRRLRLWTMGFAFKSFSHAEVGFARLADGSISQADPLFSVIACGAVVSYARPFKPKRTFGRLPDDMVPADLREVHDLLITIRDKMLAHVDASGLPTPHGEVNQLEYRVAHGVAHLMIPDYRMKKERLGDFHRLARILREKSGYHLKCNQDSLLRKLSYPDGQYRLSLDGETEVLLPVTDG